MKTDKRNRKRSLHVKSLREASDGGYGTPDQSALAISTEDRLTVNGFRLTKYGAFWGDVVPTEADWFNTLDIAFDFESGLQWIFGDLVAFGLNLGYGKIQQAVEVIAARYERQASTLHNYAMVCRAFPEEISRCRENLSFGHYQSVASIDDIEKRDLLLDKASINKWSVAKLRQQIGTPSGRTIDTKPMTKQFREVVSLFNTDMADIKPRKRDQYRGQIASLRKTLDELDAKLDT